MLRHVDYHQPWQTAPLCQYLLKSFFLIFFSLFQHKTGTLLLTIGLMLAAAGFTCARILLCMSRILLTSAGETTPSERCATDSRATTSSSFIFLFFFFFSFVSSKARNAFLLLGSRNQNLAANDVLILVAEETRRKDRARKTSASKSLLSGSLVDRFLQVASEKDQKWLCWECSSVLRPEGRHLPPWNGLLGAV